MITWIFGLLSIVFFIAFAVVSSKKSENLRTLKTVLGVCGILSLVAFAWFAFGQTIALFIAILLVVGQRVYWAVKMKKSGNREWVAALMLAGMWSMGLVIIIFGWIFEWQICQ